MVAIRADGAAILEPRLAIAAGLAGPSNPFRLVGGSK
jgi:hypothetical protein